MTQREGDYQLNCWECHTQVYSGTTPLADPRAELARWADNNCPKGGTANGCPSTSEAQQHRDDERPGQLRRVLAALREARPRGTVVPLPDLALGTPVEIAVSWTPPMPDATYRVAVTAVHGPALLGALAWCIKPGTLTRAGCVLIVRASQVVSAGQAGLHVTGTP